MQSDEGKKIDAFAFPYITLRSSFIASFILSILHAFILSIL
jgi:hypothetical protein